MKATPFYVVLIVLFLPGCSNPPVDGKVDMDMNNWQTSRIASLGIEFSHPADAVLEEFGGGIPGAVTEDGRKLVPHPTIYMEPVYSRDIPGGVFHNFPVRFTRITGESEVSPGWASKTGLTVKPSVEFVPYLHEQEHERLREAVSQLYLKQPVDWRKATPTKVAGRPATRFQFVDSIGEKHKRDRGSASRR